jgi:GNAT superfamily N-acetyltransferase
VEGPGYSFRRADFHPESGDLAFLGELYASTRREEVAQTGWTVAQIEAFLASQFEAQHRYYRDHYASAEFLVILSESGEEIGRLYLDEWEEEFRIVDIALLPAWRGKGIGSRILQEVISRARKKGKAVSIHVEQFNPAMSLYKRLGFENVSEDGVYYLMTLTPK